MGEGKRGMGHQASQRAVQVQQQSVKAASFPFNSCTPLSPGHMFSHPLCFYPPCTRRCQTQVCRECRLMTAAPPSRYAAAYPSPVPIAQSSHRPGASCTHTAYAQVPDSGLWRVEDDNSSSSFPSTAA